MRKISTSNYKRTNYKPRRPFWLPAFNYYVLTTVVAVVFFFLVWGILNDEQEEVPWITAGIGASVIMGGAVFMREVVLRKAHERYLSEQRRLDYNLRSLPPHLNNRSRKNKLTLERHAELINKIKEKSDAAKVLGKLSDEHYKVFEICNEYLSINERELKYVGTGSPRLAALRRGKEIVRNLHKYHLLYWVEIEAKALTREAQNKYTIADKLEKANTALSVLDSARGFYPNERQLIESEETLREFVASVKISHWVEQAERAAFKGNRKRAISHYKDALFFLARESLSEDKKNLIAEKINSEIIKLRETSEISIKQISNKGNKGEIYD